MFFSLQIVWCPIEAVINLLLRILGRRARPEEDTEMVNLSTKAESINSIATTAKQDPSHINIIEVQEDCSSYSTEVNQYKSWVDRKVNIMPQS
ncbi:uncharacterized protein N7483_003920 [Penicillium malachiteum]|uniref:uncharacterized protein n=1 Tax=Penicillium malachiteum TaxID=1324776 RepID=UPI00254658F9|nr:uncharacterized protein N7483_003920 [Penicillium malachiteum]KAJ5729412.1 hypothetical protein N7483_003920 [Penicillium malachiteum]